MTTIRPGDRVTCATITMEILERKVLDGTLWSAQALGGNLSSLLAIKVLFPGKLGSTFERAKGECDALSAFANAGVRVPRCHAVCDLEQENLPTTSAVVMDFVQGDGLDKVWDPSEDWDDSLGQSLVRDIWNNILALTSIGWVDIDKKPDNIMVDISAKTATFIDTGLAFEYLEVLKGDGIEEDDFDQACPKLQSTFEFLLASLEPFFSQFLDLIQTLFEDAKTEGKLDVVLAGRRCTLLQHT